MVPWFAFPGACFSGLSDILKYLVVFKWQWCNWTGQEITTWLARELGHQNWLLFVIFRAQTGLK